MLSGRFLFALQFSFELHKEQVRKSTDEVPYFSHIMSVTALVQEAGGTEDVQIAAVLHDTVEDQGGEETLAKIRELFGDFVADVVLFCSDSVERDANGEKLPWRVRKEAHINHLKSLDKSSLTDVERAGVLIMIADKLHNAQQTYDNVLQQGDAVYERFRGGKEGMLWYLSENARILGRLNGWSPLAVKLREVVKLLRDDSRDLAKILVFHGHHVISYYDASTPLSEKAAYMQIFEELNTLGCYDLISDDAYLQRMKRDIDELQELKDMSNKGKIPSSLSFGVADKIKHLPQYQEDYKEMKYQMELYKKASAGDKDSAKELVKLRSNYTSERVSEEYMQLFTCTDLA